MKRSLVALAVGTFALGIAEFGMMGILDTVSESLGVSIVAGGNLISLYSLGVAVELRCCSYGAICLSSGLC